MGGDVGSGPSFGANELMKYLEKEKSDGRKSFVAEIQGTTLLTITKADRNSEAEKAKKCHQSDQRGRSKQHVQSTRSHASL